MRHRTSPPHYFRLAAGFLIRRSCCPRVVATLAHPSLLTRLRRRGGVDTALPPPASLRCVWFRLFDRGGGALARRRLARNLGSGSGLNLLFLLDALRPHLRLRFHVLHSTVILPFLRILLFVVLNTLRQLLQLSLSFLFEVLQLLLQFRNSFLLCLVCFPQPFEFLVGNVFFIFLCSRPLQFSLQCLDIRLKGYLNILCLFELMLQCMDLLFQILHHFLGFPGGGFHTFQRGGFLSERFFCLCEICLDLYHVSLERLLVGSCCSQSVSKLVHLNLFHEHTVHCVVLLNAHVQKFLLRANMRQGHHTTSPLLQQLLHTGLVLVAFILLLELELLINPPGVDVIQLLLQFVQLFLRRGVFGRLQFDIGAGKP
mmetsp:Transcript_32040/g.89697  ORF Transcript_32040/g.89697 Transcript_32040/m.89697 type:complete len:370 (-) Transcript_32040:827-1936(-)